MKIAFVTQGRLNRSHYESIELFDIEFDVYHQNETHQSKKMVHSNCISPKKHNFKIVRVTSNNYNYLSVLSNNLYNSIY